MSIRHQTAEVRQYCRYFAVSIHRPADHHALDGPDGRDVAVGLAAQDDEIGVEPGTQAAELVAAIEERRGRASSRR